MLGEDGFELELPEGGEAEFSMPELELDGALPAVAATPNRPHTRSRDAPPAPPPSLAPLQPLQPPQPVEALVDTLTLAGVNLKEEQALVDTMALEAAAATHVTTLHAPLIPPSQLLELRMLAVYMRNAAHAQGISQGFEYDPDVLAAVLAATEQWLQRIVTRTVLLSRHRRRTAKPSAVGRNEVPAALRTIALQHRDAEKQRAAKRVRLGLDLNTGDGSGGDLVEAYNRAANNTASMMTGLRSKKKYLWMTGGSGPAGAGGGSTDARGDTGLRLRESRPGRSIVLRDVLGALEAERMGVDKVLLKGYAKMRD